MKKLALIGLLLSFAGPVWASWAYVQSATNLSATLATTNAKSFSSNTGATALITLVLYSSGALTVSSIVDTGTNTYYQALSSFGTSTGFQIWYAYNISGGTDTITVTYTPPETTRMYINEYSGIWTSNPLDVAVGSMTASNALTQSFTNSATNDLVFAAAQAGAGPFFSGGTLVPVTERSSLGSLITGDVNAPLSGNLYSIGMGSDSGGLSLGIVSFKEPQTAPPNLGLVIDGF